MNEVKELKAKIREEADRAAEQAESKPVTNVEVMLGVTVMFCRDGVWMVNTNQRANATSAAHAARLATGMVMAEIKRRYDSPAAALADLF